MAVAIKAVEGQECSLTAFFVEEILLSKNGKQHLNH
jgi:hypothetical protein